MCFLLLFFPVVFLSSFADLDDYGPTWRHYYFGIYGTNSFLSSFLLHSQVFFIAFFEFL